MISGIRIYDGNGVLKEEISSEKALHLYNETNKTSWALSPTEKKTWVGFKRTEGKTYKKISISSKRGPGC